MATMAEPIDPALLDVAVTIARKAGELTLEHFRHPDLTIDRKGDGTPVTVADRAAERLIREEIEARYPDDGILGEEEPEKPGTSGRRWILDPIDGTKAFTHGVPLYTNLLALEDEHGIAYAVSVLAMASGLGAGIAIGVINVPGLGETVYAGRGLGCFCNGAPAHVNDRQGFDESYITTSGMSPWDDDCLLRVKRAGYNIRTWGDGYGYVLVATGRVEAMFDPKAEVYDVAPMPVILEEAGGRFTDLDGNVTVAGGNGLATNGQNHEELLALLRG